MHQQLLGPGLREEAFRGIQCHSLSSPIGRPENCFAGGGGGGWHGRPAKEGQLKGELQAQRCQIETLQGQVATLQQEKGEAHDENRKQEQSKKVMKENSSGAAEQP